MRQLQCFCLHEKSSADRPIGTWQSGDCHTLCHHFFIVGCESQLSLRYKAINALEFKALITINIHNSELRSALDFNIGMCY